MTGLTVLVTGMSRFVGSALAGRLAAHPAVDRVIGVDAAMPEPNARARMGDAEFIRADIRNPVIFKVIQAAAVDTVVHASASSTPSGSAARSMAKEMNVLGTMQLLAACQRSNVVRNLVVRSTAAVYGGSARDPAIATEETVAHSVPSTGLARDALDIEGYVRGFGRRRPDVRIAVPRFCDIIGPTVRTPLTRYFSMTPVVPVLAGQDARMQLVHELDAVALMEHLALGSFAGIVNVAGGGAITVAQAVRRAGRIPVPVPSSALSPISRAVRLFGFAAFSAAQVRLLAPGRVLDTTRLREQVGFVPRFTTMAAFDDFVSRLAPAIDASSVRAAETGMAAALGVRPEPRGSIRSADWGTADRADSGAHPGRLRPRLFSIAGDAAGSAKARSRRPGAVKT
jgi:UDP-glucose 4-epimerase